MDTGSRLLLAAAVILVVFSAYFTLVGTALSEASKSALRVRQERGDRRASRALDLLEDEERASMTVLVGGDILDIAAATVTAALALDLWGAGALPWKSEAKRS